MRIACLGGGPAELYFAISAMLRCPAHDVHVFERSRAAGDLTSFVPSHAVFG